MKLNLYCLKVHLDITASTGVTAELTYQPIEF
jgi:hypothetical protein